MAAEGQPRGPWDPAPGPEPPRPHGEAVDPEISRRVSSILDAAEREVAEIRRQAREEAMRYMDYARRRADGLIAERQMRIAELSGELVGRAEQLLTQVDSAQPLRQALDDLVRKLTETAEGMTREAGGLGGFAAPEFSELRAETPPEPQEPPGEPGPTPVPDPAPDPSPTPPTPMPEPQEPPPPAATSGQLQMVAIQMAAAGHTRAEVESHLRVTLAVGDPAPILDEVFGAGSPPSATVSWARRLG